MSERPIERFGVVGFNHRLVPARLRGLLAFDDAWSEALAKRLRASGLADGVAFVSTCNRQEVVLSAAHPGFATELVRAQLHDLLGQRTEGRLPEPYRHLGEDAVRHVLRVSASLDSLVIGERQITQQLRRSFDRARKAGWMDKPLNGLARIAVESAKEIRERTSLGAESVGVFSLARELVARETAGLARPRVAVVGLGEIGLRTARALLAERRYELILSSRRPRTPAELGTSLSACPFVPLSELGALLRDCDAVVVATGAGAPIVTPDFLLGARGPGARPLVLVDLGIPQQVEAGCDGVSNARLFNLDWFAATGFGQRPQTVEALRRAHELIEDGVHRVADWTSVRRYSGLFDACVVIAERFKSQHAPEAVRNELAALEPEQQKQVLSSMHRLLTAYSEDVFQTLHRALGDPDPHASSFPEHGASDDDADPIDHRQPGQRPRAVAEPLGGLAPARADDPDDHLDRGRPRARP